MEAIGRARHLLAELSEHETRTQDDSQLQREGAISDDKYDDRFDRYCEERHAAEQAILRASPSLLRALPPLHASALARFLAAHEATECDLEDFDMHLVHARERAIEELSVGLELPGAPELHARRERHRLQREAPWAERARANPDRPREPIERALEMVERGESDDILRLAEQLLRHSSRPRHTAAPYRPALAEAHQAVADLRARRISATDAAVRLRRALAAYDAAEALELEA